MNKRKGQKVRNGRMNVADRELFLSETYHRNMLKFARVIGGKPMATLVLDYSDAPNSKIAATDGNKIYLNTGNCVTQCFPTREEKIFSHEGLISHECGHIRYSDMKRRQVYVNGFFRGCIYPKPPKGHSPSEERAIEEMKEVVKSRDRIALDVLARVAADLNNLLEDIYIEMKMCEIYPGSINQAIQKNALVLISKIPSEKERTAKKANAWTVIWDLLFRYARAGKTSEEAQYPMFYLKYLDRCRAVIDWSVCSDDSDSRFYAANELIVKNWIFIKKLIEKTQDALKTALDHLSETQKRKMIKEFLDDILPIIVLSASEVDINDSGETIEGWNGDVDGADKTSEAQRSDNQKGEEGKNTDRTQLGEFRQGSREDSEENSGENPVDIPKMMKEAAKETIQKQAEKELLDDLKQEAENLETGDIHKGIKLNIHRASNVSPETADSYSKLAPEIMRIARQLAKSLEDILERKEGGTMTGLYMGKRLSRGNLYRQDGRIFEKRIMPEDGFSLAFVVLVDNSGSMAGERIEYATKASLILQEFCRILSIPIAVYGHSTDYEIDGEYNKKETVELYSLAEFESADGNDALRILEMKSRYRNRDGLALRFAGEHLLKREEDVKILVLISDGDPSGIGYTGEVAKKDLQEIKADLRKKGVELFAAAIGSDKEQIEEIYKDGFVNISDLSSLPKKLAKLLMQYIY